MSLKCRRNWSKNPMIAAVSKMPSKLNLLSLRALPISNIEWCTRGSTSHSNLGFLSFFFRHRVEMRSWIYLWSWDSKTPSFLRARVTTRTRFEKKSTAYPISPSSPPDRNVGYNITFLRVGRLIWSHERHHSSWNSRASRYTHRPTLVSKSCSDRPYHSSYLQWRDQPSFNHLRSIHQYLSLKFSRPSLQD